MRRSWQPCQSVSVLETRRSRALEVLSGLDAEAVGQALLPSSRPLAQRGLSFESFCVHQRNQIPHLAFCCCSLRILFRGCAMASPSGGKVLALMPPCFQASCRWLGLITTRAQEALALRAMQVGNEFPPDISPHWGTPHTRNRPSR